MKSTSLSLILPAMLALTACSTSDEPVTDVPVPDSQETAMNFTAYVGRNSRVASATEVTDVNALSQVGGFGVFAYAHGQRKYDSYSLDVSYPNFFVNQQVWNSSQATSDGHKGADVAATESWQYEPVKYYDNNAGARHSFFAYAPYSKDADIVFSSGKAPQVRYNTDQDIDLLWAVPTKDMFKPETDSKVPFNFSHALTKTTFHVAPFIDKVHPDEGDHADAGHTHPISDPLPVGTTVKVKSIHLNGNLPYVALMNTEDGHWTVTQTRQYFNVRGADGTYWTGDGINVMPYYDVVPPCKLIPAHNVNIEVIYDVISEANGQKSHLTRKAVSQETIDLDQSKAYNIYLDLGLNSVKFVTTVGNWTDDGHDVDVPEGEEPIVSIETVLSVIIDWQAGVSNDADW